jgi:magnesium and cobalt transporter
VYSKDELVDVLVRSTGVLSKDETTHLRAGLDFASMRVNNVMTPRSVMESVDADEIIGPVLLDSLHKTGHSRFPVVDGDADHVVGMLYLHDLLENSDKSMKTVREAMQPKVFYIHEDQTLEHALHAFLRTRRHLFVVVNDYRETVGLLSLEDALEALLGKKIVDEFDRFEDLRAVAAHNPRANNLPDSRSDV